MKQCLVLGQEQRQEFGLVQTIGTAEMLERSAEDLEQEVQRLESEVLPLAFAAKSASSTQNRSSEVVSEPSAAACDATQADADSSDPGQSGEWVAESVRRDPDDDEDMADRDTKATSKTLSEHLSEQLATTQASEKDRLIVHVLIDHLDDDGRLKTGLDELRQFLLTELEVDEEDMRIALKLLQSFDPPGVGARDVVECLLLQLKAKRADPDKAGPSDAVHDLACTVVRGYLQEFGAKKFGQIRKALACSEADFDSAEQLIYSVNPHPGAAFARDETRYVSPEVLVKRVKGAWIVSLSPEAERCRQRVDRLKAGILQCGRGSRMRLVAGLLQEARWLIRNVKQRYETILRVAKAIVDRQHAVLTDGFQALRPLTKYRIAEELKLDPSTVSRATCGKYMLTPIGTFELARFFCNDIGGESPERVKQRIRELIDREQLSGALSDSQISEILREEGTPVARRTVAKYRDKLRIPSALDRKSRALRDRPVEEFPRQ